MKILFELKPSKIHGVGVFAREDIDKNINIYDYLFIKDDYERYIKGVDKPINEWLLENFCYNVTTTLWVKPKNPVCMSIGWYLNHSDNPNIRIIESVDYYITSRKIKQCEELTIDYKDLSPTTRKR